MGEDQKSGYSDILKKLDALYKLLHKRERLGVIKSGVTAGLLLIIGGTTIHFTDKLQRRTNEVKQHAANLEDRVFDLEMKLIDRVDGKLVSSYTPSENELDNLRKVLRTAYSYTTLPEGKWKDLLIGLKTRIDGRLVSKQYSGQGFLISEDGYFATANHVIKPAIINKLKGVYREESSFDVITEITGSGGAKYELLDYIILDPASDVAIGKVKLDKRDFSNIGLALTFKKGDACILYSCGRPDKEGKILDFYDKDGVVWIQTSIKGAPGDSGSPIVLPNGQLLGLASIMVSGEIKCVYARALSQLVDNYYEFMKKK